MPFQSTYKDDPDTPSAKQVSQFLSKPTAPAAKPTAASRGSSFDDEALTNPLDKPGYGGPPNLTPARPANTPTTPPPSTTAPPVFAPIPPPASVPQSNVPTTPQTPVTVPANPPPVFQMPQRKVTPGIAPAGGKGVKYINDPSEAPAWAEVQQSPEGRLFYATRRRTAAAATAPQPQMQSTPTTAAPTPDPRRSDQPKGAGNKVPDIRRPPALDVATEEWFQANSPYYNQFRGTLHALPTHDAFDKIRKEFNDKAKDPNISNEELAPLRDEYNKVRNKYYGEMRKAIDKAKELPSYGKLEAAQRALKEGKISKEQYAQALDQHVRDLNGIVDRRVDQIARHRGEIPAASPQAPARKHSPEDINKVISMMRDAGLELPSAQDLAEQFHISPEEANQHLQGVGTTESKPAPTSAPPDHEQKVLGGIASYYKLNQQIPTPERLMEWAQTKGIQLSPEQATTYVNDARQKLEAPSADILAEIPKRNRDYLNRLVRVSNELTGANPTPEEMVVQARRNGVQITVPQAKAILEAYANKQSPVKPAAAPKKEIPTEPVKRGRSSNEKFDQYAAMASAENWTPKKIKAAFHVSDDVAQDFWNRRHGKGTEEVAPTSAPERGKSVDDYVEELAPKLADVNVNPSASWVRNTTGLPLGTAREVAEKLRARAGVSEHAPSRPKGQAAAAMSDDDMAKEIARINAMPGKTATDAMTPAQIAQRFPVSPERAKALAAQAANLSPSPERQGNLRGTDAGFQNFLHDIEQQADEMESRERQRQSAPRPTAEKVREQTGVHADPVEQAAATLDRIREEGLTPQQLARRGRMSPEEAQQLYDYANGNESVGGTPANEYTPQDEDAGHIQELVDFAKEHDGELPSIEDLEDEWGLRSDQAEYIHGEALAQLHPVETPGEAPPKTRRNRDVVGPVPPTRYAEMSNDELVDRLVRNEARTGKRRNVRQISDSLGISVERARRIRDGANKKRSEGAASTPSNITNLRDRIARHFEKHGQMPSARKVAEATGMSEEEAQREIDAVDEEQAAGLQEPDEEPEETPEEGESPFSDIGGELPPPPSKPALTGGLDFDDVAKQIRENKRPLSVEDIRKRYGVTRDEAKLLWREVYGQNPVERPTSAPTPEPAQTSPTGTPTVPEGARNLLPQQASHVIQPPSAVKPTQQEETQRKNSEYLDEFDHQFLGLPSHRKLRTAEMLYRNALRNRGGRLGATDESVQHFKENYIQAKQAFEKEAGEIATYARKFPSYKHYLAAKKQYEEGKISSQDFNRVKDRHISNLHELLDEDHQTPLRDEEANPRNTPDMPRESNTAPQGHARRSEGGGRARTRHRMNLVERALRGLGSAIKSLARQGMQRTQEYRDKRRRFQRLRAMWLDEAMANHGYVHERFNALRNHAHDVAKEHGVNSSQYQQARRQYRNMERLMDTLDRRRSAAVSRITPQEDRRVRREGARAKRQLNHAVSLAQEVNVSYYLCTT